MKSAPFNALNKRIDIEDYEDIFTVDEDTTEDRIERLRDKNIVKCRRKTIKSGNILECEIYPITPMKELNHLSFSVVKC